MAMTDATAPGSPRISLSVPWSSGVCFAHSPRSYPSGILSRVLLARAVDTPTFRGYLANYGAVLYPELHDCFYNADFIEQTKSY